MKKTFDWVRGPEASIPELEEQLELASKLHRETIQAEKLALVGFDADPSTEPTLGKAREAVSSAKAHQDRAERLLTAAKARDKQAKRKVLLAEIGRVSADLSHEAIATATAPLVAEEVELLVQLAKHRTRYKELGSELDEKESRLRQLENQAGVERGEARPRWPSEFINADRRAVTALAEDLGQHGAAVDEELRLITRRMKEIR